MEKIIQITSGRGPVECTWVVAQVLKIMLQEAKEYNLEYSLLHHQAGLENGTIESVIINLQGDKVDDFLTLWKGTVQWIGKSTFRKFHQRKNWFIGVFEIETNREASFSEKDFKYQAMRSSGAGGQHVNKVSSVIRAVHLPSGTFAVAMDSRSQHQNKKLATERLLCKLKQVQIENLKNQFQKTWMNQLQIERGNPVRTFEGSDFKKEKKVNKNKVGRYQSKKNIKNEINR